MAILMGANETGEAVFYDIPDDVAAKSKLESKELTPEDQARLFPGKEELTKDDFHGQIPMGVGPEGAERGDVETFGAFIGWCVRYFWSGGILWRQTYLCD